MRQRPVESSPQTPLIGDSNFRVATPTSRPAPGEGVSVLDLAALIAGAAVAAVHLRGTRGTPGDNTAPAFLFWLAFVGITITASGPLVALSRRIKKLPPTKRGWGERLWVLLGTPWIVTAPFRSLPGSRAADSLYDPAVLISVSGACLAVLLIVWNHWIRPAVSIERDADPPRWSEQVGLVLAVAWPLQYGFAMIAVSL
jgi:hypothetical protein